MPSVEQILAGLREIVNARQPVAIFWHVYFAVLIVALMIGIRPSRRVFGILLALPFLSVGILAWAASNPFNGIVFALIGILLIVVSLRLPKERVQPAPLWLLIPGALIFAFGWVYPHFLDTPSFWPYLYSAPVGLIPCATLSIVIGLALILNGLRSRAFSLVLGIAGLFYGITGIFQLRVSIDAVLLVGAALMILVALLKKGGSQPAENQ